jgi:hypothetical protein
MQGGSLNRKEEIQRERTKLEAHVDNTGGSLNRTEEIQRERKKLETHVYQRVQMKTRKRNAQKPSKSRRFSLFSFEYAAGVYI